MKHLLSLILGGTIALFSTQAQGRVLQPFEGGTGCDGSGEIELSELPSTDVEIGTTCIITNGASNMDCTPSGTGSTQVECIYDGSNWRPRYPILAAPSTANTFLVVDSSGNLEFTAATPACRNEVTGGAILGYNNSTRDFECSSTIKLLSVVAGAGSIAEGDIEWESVTDTLVVGTSSKAQVQCNEDGSCAGLGVYDADYIEEGQAAGGDLTGTYPNPTIAANAVALGTDTTGNYVATIADAGNSTIAVTGSGSETAAVTLDAIDLNCTDCLNATEIEDIYLFNSGDVSTGTLGVEVSAALPFYVEDTDAGVAGQVAQFRFTGTSPTPLAGDEGYITLSGNDAGGSMDEVCRIVWEWIDPTNTTEDGQLRLQCDIEGSTRQFIAMSGRGASDSDVVINPSNQDINLIYEGGTNADVLVCDAGTEICDFRNAPTVGGTAVDVDGHTHIESDVTDLVHTTDTNANTICTGTTTYLDGEGNCDDISSVYMPIAQDDWVDETGDTMTGDLQVQANMAVGAAAVTDPNKILLVDEATTATSGNISGIEIELDLANASTKTGFDRAVEATVDTTTAQNVGTIETSIFTASQDQVMHSDRLTAITGRADLGGSGVAAATTDDLQGLNFTALARGGAVTNGSVGALMRMSIGSTADPSGTDGARALEADVFLGSGSNGGTISSITVIEADFDSWATRTPTITDVTGIRIDGNVSGPTITNIDQLRLDALDASGSGRTVAIRQLGTTGHNRLQGDTSIGQDSAPDAALEVAGNAHIDGNANEVQLRIDANSGQTADIIEAYAEDGTLRFEMTAMGHIHNTLAMDDTSGIIDGFEIDLDVAPSGASTAEYNAVRIDAQSTNTNMAATVLRGIDIAVDHSTASAIGGLQGYRSVTTHSSGTNSAIITGNQFQVVKSGNANITLSTIANQPRLDWDDGNCGVVTGCAVSQNVLNIGSSNNTKSTTNLYNTWISHNAWSGQTNTTITNYAALIIGGGWSGPTITNASQLELAAPAAVTDITNAWGIRQRDGNDRVVNSLQSSLGIGADSTTVDTTLHLNGTTAAITFEESSATPSNPTSGTQARVYVKGDKFIIQFNNGGTVRYFYIDLTQTAAQSVQHTTSAP